MRLLVAVDGHIIRTPDNKFWCKTIYSYGFFERYLNVFEDVTVVARVKDVEKLEGKYKRIDGEHVEVRGMPFYQGPVQLLKKYIPIQKALRNIDKGCDAALFRLPEQSCQMAYRHMRKGLPFAGEIVYDPTDDLKRTDIGIILRFLNNRISKNLKEFCAKANGVSYVTEHTIQEHYPSYARLHGEDREHFESYYSTITLADSAFTTAREFTVQDSITIVLCDAAINSDRKGEKTFLEALAKLRNKGLDVKGILIGDGSMLGYFKKMAEDLGIKSNVQFTGLLPSSKDVQDVMKTADIFVFPTQAEGLPRGILEAMAVGMPVLSTPVGGIPEVIDRKYLFEPNDVDGFANEIERLMENPDELTQMSKNNFQRSLDFQNDRLQARRDAFYTRLKNLCK